MSLSGKVAIIIPNWNGLRFLKECLSAVFAQTYTNFEVYFVDNGSTDGSIEFVTKNFPQVKIISLDHNTGFAYASNAGIMEAFKDGEVEYIVALNNDTKAEPEWLAELVKVAESDQKIGSVSSYMYFTDGIVHNLGIGLSRDGHGEGIDYLQTETKHKEVFSIPTACGGAALYRRLALERVGLFDADFFAYYEDVDLGLRLRHAGYQNVCAPTARVLHYHSGTAEPLSLFKLFYGERNRLLMMFKNFPAGDIWRAVRRSPGEYWRLLKRRDQLVATTTRPKISKWRLVFTMIRAYLSAICLFPKEWGERKKILANSQIPRREIGNFLQ